MRRAVGRSGFTTSGAEILLAFLVLGGLGFGVTRLRRGRRAAPRDDEWIRREPPPEPPSPLSPREPSPDGTTVSPARAPRAAVSGGRPAAGWALETSGLTKRFGANVAVDDVELHVPRGSAFGYLGPNGAGKTTLIRTLLGLTRADGGTMSLLGIAGPSRSGSGRWPGSARSSTSPGSTRT